MENVKFTIELNGDLITLTRDGEEKTTSLNALTKLECEVIQYVAKNAKVRKAE